MLSLYYSDPCSAWSDWNHVYSCHNTSVIPFWSILTRTCHQTYQNSLISPEVSYRNIWCLCLWKCPHIGHFLIFPHPYFTMVMPRHLCSCSHLVPCGLPCSMRPTLFHGPTSMHLFLCSCHETFMAVLDHYDDGNIVDLIFPLKRMIWHSNFEEENCICHNFSGRPIFETELDQKMCDGITSLCNPWSNRLFVF